jgi:hypothetical protein
METSLIRDLTMKNRPPVLIPLPFFSSKDKEFEEWIGQSRGSVLEDKDAFVKYLREGICVAAVPGIERDPFNQNRIIRDTPNVMTDGKWVWVQTLAHWVESLDVSLPSEFVEELRKRNFETIGSVDLAASELPWQSNPNFFKQHRHQRG